ncbi:hypothetical protein [Streptomyces sp. NPDC088766]|uniref:hypothetical protein n=1 Tax=Streptomyces sp. NPDC088766 TaxID=3365893 RepID=UPI0037FEB55E
MAAYPSRRLFTAALPVACVPVPVTAMPATAGHAAAVGRNDREDREDREDRDGCPPDGLGPELAATRVFTAS